MCLFIQVVSILMTVYNIVLNYEGIDSSTFLESSIRMGLSERLR